MNQKVIDVSYHNGKIDWEAIKDASIHAIIRCGYGDDAYTQDDKQYQYNISECERLDIPFGLYLYSYATSWEQIKSEVSHTLRLAEGHQLSYPIYFDSEEPGTENVSQTFAEYFCQEIEKQGYWAGIYASDSWFQNNMSTVNSWFTKWVARYSSSSPKTECDMWQFTSSGEINGISGNVDISECYRDFPTEILGQKTGWVLEDDEYSYINESHEKVFSDWIFENGHWYYLDENGKMVKWWKEIDGKWYYFNGNGEMQANCILPGNTEYILDHNGAMITPDRIQEDGSIIY